MMQADHRDEASTSMLSLARLVDADLRCYLAKIATDPEWLNKIHDV